MMNSQHATELRRKAETRLSSQPSYVEALSGEVDAKRLLHELQVHQVELVMQNEELQLAKQDLQIANLFLEEQVADRTRELTGAVSKLREEIAFRKQAEHDNLLLQQQFQQAQKLESLGVLAGGIAHDFNNILTIIISSCTLAQKRPDMVEELLPEIETAAERAAELCRQMLAYAGKSLFTMKQIRMTTLVGDMIKMLKATINQNVAITSDLTADFPLIMGDVGQLRQIIMNLIINASEAIGEEQGVIHVSLSRDEIKAEGLDNDHLGKVIPVGQYLRLEVADNGCGMDDETAHRLFEPFFTTKFTGRGLGLSAVLGIITAHNGFLQVNSHLGQGSTFKVYLPVQLSVSVEEVAPPAKAAPWRGSGTILLAEDEVDIRYVADLILKDMGFNVIAASDGREALELYQKHASEITLVVTDLGMPRMDGYELLRELKMLDPALPIIVSSGFGDAEISFRIPCGEIAGLVSKPYNYDQMQEVLKSALMLSSSPKFQTKS